MNLQREIVSMEDRGKLGEEGDAPVDGCLPCSVVEAVEHVQEHGADVAVGLEVENLAGICLDGFAGVALLECVSTAPDDHGDDQEHDQGDLCAHCSAELRKIKSVTEDQCAEDLTAPV